MIHPFYRWTVNCDKNITNANYIIKSIYKSKYNYKNNINSNCINKINYKSKNNYIYVVKNVINFIITFNDNIYYIYIVNVIINNKQLVLYPPQLIKVQKKGLPYYKVMKV